MFGCKCFFCVNGLNHPDDRHPVFEPTTHVLLVAESLDPRDSVQVEACVLCGHERPAK